MMVDDAPLLDMDVNYAAPSDLPVYVGTIQSCNIEKTTHGVSFELNNEGEDPIFISSPILTETLVDNNPILDIYATPKTSKKEVKTKKIQLVEHNAIVRSERLVQNSSLSVRRVKSNHSMCKENLPN
jgi:hypothetical protein